MTNKAKIVGSAWEREIVAYLIANGFPYAERRFGAGQSKDAGDINGLQLVIEAKSLKTITLSSIMDETEVEIGNSHFDTGMAMIKRRGKSAGHGYAVMSIERMAKLLKDSGF